MTCKDGHFLQWTLSPSCTRREWKQALVNEFTGADVSLDKAAGGVLEGEVLVVGGFKSLAAKEKRETEWGRERQKPGTKTVQSTGH